MQFSHISQQRVKQRDARRSIVSNDVRPAFSYHGADANGRILSYYEPNGAYWRQYDILNNCILPNDIYNWSKWLSKSPYICGNMYAFHTWNILLYVIINIPAVFLFNWHTAIKFLILLASKQSYIGSDFLSGSCFFFTFIS